MKRLDLIDWYNDGTKKEYVTVKEWRGKGLYIDSSISQKIKIKTNVNDAGEKLYIDAIYIYK